MKHSCALAVAIEQHFVEVEGKVYTDIAFDYDYWREYLEVFDRVEPVARVGKADKVPDGWVRADGPGVRFHKVCDYLGFWSFLRHWPRVLRDCARALGQPGPVLLRMGNISLMCWLYLVLNGRPYAFEVVGHAGQGATMVKNVQIFKLGHLIGFIQHYLCRVQAAGAACASYVSQYVRSLYPARRGREWVFSSVKLPEDVFCVPREAKAFKHEPHRIVSVGRIEPEKGHHILIQAMAELGRKGESRVTLDIVGPGSQIEPLKQLCGELGLADRVRLLGRIPPGEPIRDLLDQADLFVLPSLTEGMPRALLEAMARGVPAIGSRAGGIVELLPSESLVEPGDPQALADKIATVLDDSERLADMSQKGVAVARKYRQDVMDARKRKFWRCIQRTCVSSR